MEPTMLFKDLTYADRKIVGDELKAT